MKTEELLSLKVFLFTFNYFSLTNKLALTNSEELINHSLICYSLYSNSFVKNPFVKQWTLPASKREVSLSDTLHEPKC